MQDSNLAAQKMETALDCEHESIVIEGFMERYDVTYEEANDIFKETKKWLWLAANSSDAGGLFIDKPLQIIDEMWHTFILHTKAYYDFCYQHFKHLIHHYPTPKQKKASNKAAFLTDPDKAMAEHQAKVARQYELIYDELGPETLVKWYDTMAKRYTPEHIKSIKKD